MRSSTGDHATLCTTASKPSLASSSNTLPIASWMAMPSSSPDCDRIKGAQSRCLRPHVSVPSHVMGSPVALTRLLQAFTSSGSPL